MNLNDFAVPNKLPQHMLTMFFGKRNKLKVFILWRVRAELNFSFLSYDLVYT